MQGAVNYKLKAASLHCLRSAPLIGLLTYFIYWYLFPYPYGRVVAGGALPAISVLLGIGCGGLLVLVLARHGKQKREVFWDYSLVILIQSLAVLYGIWVMLGVRPVYLVFEVDRFRAVSALEVSHEQLASAPEKMRYLPLGQIRLIGTRKPLSNDELVDSVNLSLMGIEPSMRPSWWQPLELSESSVIEASKSVADLVVARPDFKERIDAEIDRIRIMSVNIKSAEDILWLPLVGRSSNEWVVFLRKKDLLPLGYLPIDGFLK